MLPIMPQSTLRGTVFQANGTETLILLTKGRFFS